MMVRSSDFKFWEGILPDDRLSYDDEVHSPRMWTKQPAGFGQETSNLLPQNHQKSCLSPKSRLRAIVDGRKELTEMINNIPESSYELSLKDIVDEKKTMGEEEPAEEKKVKGKSEITKNTRTKQICRTESMESKVFLLKMFLPLSLGSNKGKVRKCSRQSSERSEKSANKEWWKTIFLAEKHNTKNTTIKRCTSDISSNRTRVKKDKSRAERGCLF